MVQTSVSVREYLSTMDMQNSLRVYLEPAPNLFLPILNLILNVIISTYSFLLYYANSLSGFKGLNDRLLLFFTQAR